MKKMMWIIAFAVVLFGCSQKSQKEKEDSQTVPAKVEDISSNNRPDSHSANVSLDYWGIYKGVLPCPDCDGIDVEIVLKEGDTFVSKSKYIGKGDGTITEEKGPFTWNKEGNSITLVGVKNIPGQYFVGENQLFQLDTEGKRITSEQAGNYILKK